MYAVMRLFKRFYTQSSTKVDLSNEKWVHSVKL